MKKYHELTEEDQRFIEENYLTMSDRQVSQAIRAGQSAVQTYREKNGLFKSRRVQPAYKPSLIKELDIELGYPAQSLTLAELPDLLSWYRYGLSEWQLCQRYRTTPQHLHEGLAVARLLHQNKQQRWGLPPDKPARDPELIGPPPQKTIEKTATPAAVTGLQPKPRIDWERPKAEYSNRSPYGVASPGLER